MNRQLLLGTAVLVVAGLYFLWPAHAVAASPAAATDLFAVRRGDLAIAITENGTMVAKESQKLTTKVKSESKVLFLIEEGKQVAEGEVVCRLDPTQVKTQLEQINLDIEQTKASLNTAKTELEIQGVENEAAVAKAKIALDKAGKEREKYVNGDGPQERRKLDVALKDAQKDFNRAKKNLDDSQKLLEQNYIKASEVEDHQIAFDRAQVQLDGAEISLRMYDKYTDPMAMTDQETKVSDAEREVATAKKRGDSQLNQKQVAVHQVEQRLKLQTEQLKERQEDLDNMELKAPCPGIVVYGDPHEPYYRDRIKVGASIWSGFTVMTIPDLRVMQVKLQIHEADISKLKLGLKATVTTDSYPGLQLPGEVTKIATVANSSSDWGGSSEVKKFDVEVTLDPKEMQMRPGISAKCEIHVETVTSITYVPLQSVFAEDGVHYCHVQEQGNGPVKHKIEVGKSNDVYIEVTAGLTEGDHVLLYNPMLPQTEMERELEKGAAPEAKPAEAKTVSAPTKSGA